MSPSLRTLLPTLLTTLSLAAPALSQGYVCAEGGGNAGNGNWAPTVFGWMVAKAGPAPDAIVIGISGGDANAQAAFLAAGAATATPFAVNSGNANLQSTYDTIAAADIVWMRGGDQWQYVSQWGGTRAEQAIRDVWQRGDVVGGSSAGCAVLSELVFDARNGTVFPDEALADAYDSRITLTDDFLPFVPDAIFDTHFTERGRLGRLAVFTTRPWEDEGRDLLGIGVDDRTALCVSPDGTAEILGEGCVTFLHRDAETQTFLQPGLPPILASLAHTQLTEGYVIDLATRTVLARPANAVLPPPPTSDPTFAAIDLDGSKAADANRGEWKVLDGGDDLALFLGKLQVVPGDDLLHRTVVSTRVWNSTVWDENRVGGPQYAQFLDPHLLAVFLDGGVRASTTSLGRLTATGGGAGAAVLLLDSHGVVSVAQSTYLSSSSSAGPRQSVALEGARLHALREGTTFDATSHRVLGGTPYGTGKVTSLGKVARLEWDGTPSLEIDTFGLRLRDGRPNQAGLVFWGDAAADIPLFGASLLVQPPLVRGDVMMLDADGGQLFPQPVDATMVGTTRYFQAWFRDPGHPDQTGVGITNGVEVTFRP